VQVLTNLLSNAAKYSDPGGTVFVAIRSEGTDAILSVRDTGIGIAPDILPHVFDLFRQGTVADDRKGGGLGIGLAIVRRLVEMHGGSVTASSAGLGLGSHFVIRLPLLRETSPRVPSAVYATGSRKLRILIADDNPDAVAMLSLLLQARGHEVHTADDGIEAIEVAEAVRPEVVLLDLGMPRLDGCGAARRIREQEWGRSLLLVAITGLGQPEDRRRATEAGFDLHLMKPVEIDHLEGVLADAFDPRTASGRRA
jgi:CheY-like chemotaxis protein